jgi:chromosome partitioning protein
MIITIAQHKGGVGKSTSAVHLAALLNEQAPTLLVDGDPNRSATAWNARGGLPCRVIDERQAARYAREFENIVIDTAARPDRADLEALAGGCDLLILPTTPDALSLDALIQTVDVLKALNTDKYRVLLTMTPPTPSRDAVEARELLSGAGIPLFNASIRRRVAFQKAALAGTTVKEVADTRAADGWADYAEVLKEIQNGRK